jgi:hypothetical protein
MIVKIDVECEESLCATVNETLVTELMKYTAKLGLVEVQEVRLADTGNEAVVSFHISLEK